jgi:hypothetical protein
MRKLETEGYRKKASEDMQAEITPEMKDWFDKRTNKHIDLVKKYMKAIIDFDEERFGKLSERLETHDQSKFESPERDPYVFVSWDYKCKEDGVDYDLPSGMKDKMNEATLHHVVNNSHHAEYHSGKKTGLLNREDRDKPPANMVDATSMPDLDIAEMVADWVAMGEEKGNSAKSWADKNVGVRWEFTDEQKDLIYELIEAVG